MGHFVTVTDPWFGSYLWIRGTDQYSSVRPEVLIGPLTTRRFRSEVLLNQGDRVQYRRTTEKPCQHSYVEGSISGTVSWQPYDGLVWCGPGSTTAQYISPEFDIVQVQIDYTVDWVETTTSVSVAVSFVESLTGDEGPVYIQSYGIALAADVVTDQQTGAVSYTGWTEVSRSGDNCEGIAFSIGAAPFQTGQIDTLSGSIPSLFDFVQKEMDETLRVKPGRSGRDKAIYDALDNLSLSNINWIETAADIKDLLDTIKSFLDLFKPVNNLWDWLKKFANMWLFWKYVVLTTVMDINDLIALINLLRSNLGRLPELIRTSDMLGYGTFVEHRSVGGCDITVRHNAKLAYGPDLSSLEGFLARLSLLHFVPKLEDLWDLVPYSFVIDWVLPVTDAVNNLENQANQQRLPLLDCVLSTKTDRSLSRSFSVTYASVTHTFTVDLRFVNYDRVALHELPSDMWLGISFRDPRKQWVTALALIVQRKAPTTHVSP